MVNPATPLTVPGHSGSLRTTDRTNKLKPLKENEASAIARRVLLEQAHALSCLATTMNGSFDQAVACILATQGRIVVCGLGKSGLIGKKIAATFASTGTPSLYLHPTEAYHGDLGMVTPLDTALMISNSGETEEILRLIRPLKKMGVSLIGIGGTAGSTLERGCDVFIQIKIEREACPNNLAPTTSTVATAAIGDALAVALMELKNFQPHEFAAFHPGGALGKRLSTVAEHMSCTNLPTVFPTSPLLDAVEVMTSSRMGLAVVVDEQHSIKGIFTDGDLRRLLRRGGSVHGVTVEQEMNSKPKTVSPLLSLGEASTIMHAAKVKALLVADHDNRLLGILDIYGV